MSLMYLSRSVDKVDWLVLNLTPFGIRVRASLAPNKAVSSRISKAYLC